MKPEGYGLYSDNVYLTGAIYATKGRIGSLSIDEVENTADTVNTITTKDATGKVIINKGSLTADSISAGLITTNHLSSKVGEELVLSSNKSIKLIVDDITNDYTTKIEVLDGKITSEISRVEKESEDADAAIISETKSLISQTENNILLSVKNTYVSNDSFNNTLTNYPTKTETSSMIEVSKTGILQTVSTTYATKDSLGNYATTSWTTSQINQKAESITLGVTSGNITSGAVKTSKIAINDNSIEISTGGALNLTGNSSIVLSSGNSAVTIQPNYFNITADSNRFYIENGALHILNITAANSTGTGLKLDNGSLYITSAAYSNNKWEYDTANPYVRITKDGGLEAKSGSFTTLSIGGRDVSTLLNLGVDRIAVQTSQPTTGNTLWLKPTSTSKLTYQWYTGDNRNEYNGLYPNGYGVNSGTRLLTASSSDPNAFFPDGLSYNYSFAFEVSKIEYKGHAANNTAISITVYGYNNQGEQTQLTIPEGKFFTLGSWDADEWGSVDSATVQAGMTVRNSSVNLCGLGATNLTMQVHTQNGSYALFINKEQYLTFTATTEATGEGAQACAVFYIP